VGDPACDVTIAWTLLSGESRRAFRAALALDDATWVRGRGWALWKALIELHRDVTVTAPTVVPTWERMGWVHDAGRVLDDLLTGPPT
jgi:hypothetical protein